MVQRGAKELPAQNKGKIFVHVCMCVWRSDMEIGRGCHWRHYGATVGNDWRVLERGGSSANLEELMRMGAMEPLDGDILSCFVLNVTLTWTWTCTWTRSNKVVMLEFKLGRYV